MLELPAKLLCSLAQLTIFRSFERLEDAQMRPLSVGIPRSRDGDRSYLCRVAMGMLSSASRVGLGAWESRVRVVRKKSMKVVES